MISVGSSGSFANVEKYLKRLISNNIYSGLDRYGEAGISALASATPVDTGLTAQSWRYQIVKTKYGPSIEWYNTNTNNGEIIAILLQYGHGTGTGGYVRGRDYINPAIQPIFDQIVNDFVKEVSR